jgi:hypothetical protein
MILYWMLIQKYSFRKIFGTLPCNVEEEDLVDPQVSSLNLLKEQRARKAANAAKALAGNATSTRHHTVHMDHDKTIEHASGLLSSTSETIDLQRSLPSASSNQPSEHDDWSWNFEDENSGQCEVAPRRPITPSRGGAFTLPRSSFLTDQLLPQRLKHFENVHL